MGCTTSASKKLSDDPAKYANDAFVLKIERALRVPSMDVGSESDPYVRVRSLGKTYGRTPFKLDDPDPIWNYVIDVTGVRLDGEIGFDLYDRDRTNMNDRIGFSRISVRDLIKRPKSVMLVLKPDGSGDFVIKKSSNLPTELHVSIIKIPTGWPQPTVSPFEKGVPKSFTKHVMIMTRGTRGDVQPYCALARGLANMKGWCVTIVTELRYKDFVEKNAKGLDRGAIRYRPSGGDTHSRIDKPIARWAMAHQSELMQLAMIARSEREFFASEPVAYYWAETMRPDGIIYGFTMVNIALIISEKLKIPIVGFVLQPTTIPSKAYPPVACIDTHLVSFVDSMEKKASNHEFNQWFKKWMEDDPIWAPLSTMRERRGLRPFKGSKSETFNILLDQKAQIVVPINEIAFGGRPTDWPDSIQMTDFIFLQGGATPKLSKEILDFIATAKAAGDPVIAMTFSSMPVSRSDIIQSSLKIVKECVSHPRVIALSGSKVNDNLKNSLAKDLQTQVQAGKILELDGAPFGLLFDHLDGLCVHGGLGTTAEAMRAGLPTTVVGVLLMDQRFWGMQCHKLGIGHQMVHIASWKKQCVVVVDSMLVGESRFKKAAKELAARIQPNSPDGVLENVEAVCRAFKIAVPIDTGSFVPNISKLDADTDSEFLTLVELENQKVQPDAGADQDRRTSMVKRLGLILSSQSLSEEADDEKYELEIEPQGGEDQDVTANDKDEFVE